MSVTTICVKDTSGRTVGYLDDETIRDINAKVIAHRVSGDREALALSDATARLMTGRQVSSVPTKDGKGKLVAMDLGMPDVASATAARASFVQMPDQPYIADAVAPPLMIKHDRGTYWLENVGDSIQLAIANETVAGAPAPEFSPAYTSTTFATVGFGLAVRMPIRGSYGNADFDLPLAAMRRCVEGLRLAREIRVANLMTTAANWATANQVAAATKWNNATGANPLKDMFAARATSWLAPTAIAMSESVEQFWFQNAGSTAVRDFVQSGGVLPRPLIGRARKMVAGVPSFVWGTTACNAVLLREVEDVSTEIGTARTLRWLGKSPDGEEKDGFLTRAFVTIEGDKVYYTVATHNDLEVLLDNPSRIGALVTGVVA